MAAMCAAPAVPAQPCRVAESPLDQAGHVGSSVLRGNEAWLAALDGRRTPGELRYLANQRAAKAAAQREADRAANAAFRPGEFLPAPTRTDGPMSGGRHAGPDTTTPAELDEHADAVFRDFDDLHNALPIALVRVSYPILTALRLALRGRKATRAGE